MSATWTLSLLLGLAPAAGAPSTGSLERVRPILEQSCYVCHNSSVKNADLNLEAYADAGAVVADPHTWEKVVERVRTRVMPPPPLPGLTDQEAEALAGWVESTLERADALAPPNPGRVTARRLNRTEYNNTVRDLLGVTLRPADDFPQDDSGYGFDNNGDVLSLSPTLLEKYLVAAERVSRAALFGLTPPKPSLVRLTPTRARIESSPVALFDYDETGLSLPNSIHAVHRFPVEGEYVVRAVLGGERPAGSEPVDVGFFVDDREVAVLTHDPEGLGSFYDDRQDFTGKTAELRTRVAAGDRRLAASIVRLYEGLPTSYAGPHPSKRPPPPPPVFEPPPDATPEKLEKLRKAFEEKVAETVPANQVKVVRLEIVGPYDPARGPSEVNLRSVYSCGHLHGGHSEGCARTILGRLARRAYRRPVDENDVRPLLELAERARRRGASFEESVGLALQAILVAPDFLFRIERGRASGDGARGHLVTDHELATRLSYFLWSSTPDDELLSLADAGRLRELGVLETQVRRMLEDPKSEALVDAFAGQWLQFRALESTSPDSERFPDFENNLRLSMRRETELFFASVVREDRSILDLIDAPDTWLNERLARHYGIEGVRGPEFRHVERGGSHRGGVLTQASVLTVSSYATRTSPVLRGKWILENILNAPPPDPPPGVPRLDEVKVGAEAPLRQQLEAHRVNPSCAACHQKMDPLGFALENFDATGAWRSEDGKWPIDATAALPDGRKFEGPDGLRRVLRAERSAFAECVTDKLLTFALGRGLERYDRRTVRAIARSIAERDYRFSTLVTEIVRSLPFQRRREETSS